MSMFSSLFFQEENRPTLRTSKSSLLQALPANTAPDHEAVSLPTSAMTTPQFQCTQATDIFLGV